MTTASPPLRRNPAQRKTRPLEVLLRPAHERVKRFAAPPGSEFAHLYDVWPSLGWGEKEWLTLFEAREDVYLAILDGIAAINRDTDSARAAEQTYERREARRLRDSEARERAVERRRGTVPIERRKPREEVSSYAALLRELAWGFSREEAAANRGRSRHTIHSQLRTLSIRYGAANTTELVSYAFRDLPMAMLPGDLRPYLLSTREHEALVGIARGMATVDIGARLFVESNTAKTHLRRLYAALDVENSRQAVSYGFRAGMLFWDGDTVVGWRCGKLIDL